MARLDLGRSSVSACFSDSGTGSELSLLLSLSVSALSNARWYRFTTLSRGSEPDFSGSRGMIVLLEKHVHLQNDVGAEM